MIFLLFYGQKVVNDLVEAARRAQIGGRGTFSASKCLSLSYNFSVRRVKSCHANDKGVSQKIPCVCFKRILNEFLDWLGELQKCLGFVFPKKKRNCQKDVTQKFSYMDNKTYFTAIFIAQSGSLDGLTIEAFKQLYVRKMHVLKNNTFWKIGLYYVIFSINSNLNTNEMSCLKLFVQPYSVNRVSSYGTVSIFHFRTWSRNRWRFFSGREW